MGFSSLAEHVRYLLIKKVSFGHRSAIEPMFCPRPEPISRLPPPLIFSFAVLRILEWFTEGERLFKTPNSYTVAPRCTLKAC